MVSDLMVRCWGIHVDSGDGACGDGLVLCWSVVIGWVFLCLEVSQAISAGVGC